MTRAAGLLVLLLLAAAAPAQAILELNWDDFRLFTGSPGRFSVLGTTGDLELPYHTETLTVLPPSRGGALSKQR